MLYTVFFIQKTSREMRLATGVQFRYDSGDTRMGIQAVALTSLFRASVDSDKISFFFFLFETLNERFNKHKTKS